MIPYIYLSFTYQKFLLVTGKRKEVSVQQEGTRVVEDSDSLAWKVFALNQFSSSFVYYFV